MWSGTSQGIAHRESSTSDKQMVGQLGNRRSNLPKIPPGASIPPSQLREGRSMSFGMNFILVAAALLFDDRRIGGQVGGMS